MATERKWRRGTTAQHASFTGAAGEVTLDTDRYGAVVHDGATAGGKYRWPTSKELQDNSMVYAAVSGTDTLTWSLTPAPAAYTAGMGGLIKIANNNTASATGNVNSLGAKTFKKMTSAGLADLAAGDLIAGGIYPWVYDGTYILITGGALGSGGGGWTKIDSQTVSGVSSVSFDNKFDSNYDTYMLVGEKVVPSEGADFAWQVGYGGTPTYLTNNYVATQFISYSNDTGGPFVYNAAWSYMRAHGITDISGVAEFEFIIGNVNSTSLRKGARWRGLGAYSTNVALYFQGAGFPNDTNAINNALTSIKCLPTSGTFSGVFTLYGLKRT